MARLYKEAARRLYETAQSQQGFFTTKQAIRGGLAEKTHAYHVKAGNWIRVHRGIYRLADFPPAERPYGIETVMQDDSGNWFSLVQRPG